MADKEEEKQAVVEETQPAEPLATSPPKPDVSEDVSTGACCVSGPDKEARKLAKQQKKALKEAEKLEIEKDNAEKKQARLDQLKVKLEKIETDGEKALADRAVKLKEKISHISAVLVHLKDPEATEPEIDAEKKAKFKALPDNKRAEKIEERTSHLEQLKAKLDKVENQAGIMMKENAEKIKERIACLTGQLSDLMKEESPAGPGTDTATTT